jgi:ABC-type Na+ efflux pump permease subunit
MSKRARPPLVRPAAKQSPTSRAAAVGFFALLPIAVVIGVAIGHSGSSEGDNEALLKALQQRQATAASTTAAPTAATAAATPKAAKKKAAKAEKTDAKPKEKVVAHTANGDVHEVTDFHASQAKESEDTKLVEENPEQTGENYIKAQQNLPDVIVVGGEGGSAPAPAGAEP